MALPVDNILHDMTTNMPEEMVEHSQKGVIEGILDDTFKKILKRGMEIDLLRWYNSMKILYPCVRLRLVCKRWNKCIHEIVESTREEQKKQFMITQAMNRRFGPTVLDSSVPPMN